MIHNDNNTLYPKSKQCTLRLSVFQLWKLMIEIFKTWLYNTCTYVHSQQYTLITLMIITLQSSRMTSFCSFVFDQYLWEKKNSWFNRTNERRYPVNNETFDNRIDWRMRFFKHFHFLKFEWIFFCQKCSIFFSTKKNFKVFHFKIIIVDIYFLNF